MSQGGEDTSISDSCGEELLTILRKIYMNKADKMNSGNDSIVISDTPSPAKVTKWTNSVMNDYRKRLRSNSSTNLLGTVYESPLMHFKRSKITDAEAIMEMNDVTIVTSPSAKKFKPKAKRVINLDESVVIVNDTPAKKALSVIELGLSDTELNDVVEVPEPIDAPRPMQARHTPKVTPNRKKDENPARPCRAKLRQATSKKAKKKETNLKDPKNLKVARVVIEPLNINNENHDRQIMDNNRNSTNECTSAAGEDGGDVEVVWISGPDVTAQQQVPSTDNPFVVDTTPMLANLVNAINQKPSKKMKRLQQAKKKICRSPKKKSLRSRAPPSEPSELQQSEKEKSKEPRRLREIVIDGPNVGMGYLCGKGFSEKGLKLVVDYFKERGHTVKVFLPQHMRTRDRTLLEQLYREGTVVFTPSRYIGGKMIAPYDDRFILDYATRCNGIVISSDQYRDLWQEKPQWRETIEKRLLTPTFAGNYLMFPEDPLGRTGPKLDEFLRH